MKKIKSKESWVLVLSFFLIFSFFLGFFLKENSAGAGGLNADFKNTWNNLNTFLNHGILKSLEFIKNGDREYYVSSRVPLLYIINSLLNPFTYSIESFIKSIFILSFFGYLLFNVALLLNFKNFDKKIILLLSCTILISPYYRTSSYWGAEENYGIISTILAFLFFINYSNSKYQKNYNLFFSILFSSICVYLDQKLIIVPLLLFINILLEKKINLNTKIYSAITYFIFSIPFIYLIISWQNIIPTGDSIIRSTGKKIFLHHPLYSTTMMAFYVLPLLIFKKNLILEIKKILKNKFSLASLIIFSIYASLIFLYDFIEIDSYGKGVVNKFVVIFIKNIFLKKFIVFLISIFSFYIILVFCQKNIYRIIFFYFFIISSSIIWPIYQEYYDPLIIITFFLFFYDKNNEILSKKNILLLLLYLIVFLILAIIYYGIII